MHIKLRLAALGALLVAVCGPLVLRAAAQETPSAGPQSYGDVDQRIIAFEAQVKQLKDQNAELQKKLIMVPLAPGGGHESDEDYLERCKAQVKVSVTIPPGGAHETSEDFRARLKAQVQIPTVLIEPGGAHETSEDLQERLKAQVKVSVTIPPGGAHETSEDFRARLKAQVQTPTMMIEPGGAHETSEEFLARLKFLVQAYRKQRAG